MAVGSNFETGVLVAVGGNHTTVGVGVSEGAGVSVGVGGIRVGCVQEVSIKIVSKQASKLTHLQIG